jgi:hypothetical protein
MDSVSDLTAPPSCGAEPINGSACWCGAPLPARCPTGRPRTTCSIRCRRLRDVLVRRLRRREEWIAAWRAEEGRRNYSPAQVERELWQLRRELFELLAALHVLRLPQSNVRGRDMVHDAIAGQ